MTKFLKHQLEVYFAERPVEAERFTGQVLVNKRSREKAEVTRLDLKKKLSSGMDIANRVEKFVRKYSDVVQVWDTKDYELKGVDPSVRGLVSPLVMAAQLERVSAHFEHVRNHSLEIRRYYRTVEY